MTLTMIFLGWFILNSLWGFLPVIEPLRLFAIASPRHRKMTALATGLLGLFSGALLLLWIGNYSTVIIMTYDAHAASALSQTQAAVNVFSVTSEITLRQLLPGAACLNANAAVCAMASQALQLGSMNSMLFIIILAALIPALTAAFICWKLTAS